MWYLGVPDSEVAGAVVLDKGEVDGGGVEDGAARVGEEVLLGSVEDLEGGDAGQGVVLPDEIRVGCEGRGGHASKGNDGVAHGDGIFQASLKDNENLEMKILLGTCAQGNCAMA